MPAVNTIAGCRTTAEVAFDEVLIRVSDNHKIIAVFFHPSFKDCINSLRSAFSVGADKRLPDSIVEFAFAFEDGERMNHSRILVSGVPSIKVQPSRFASARIPGASRA